MYRLFLTLIIGFLLYTATAGAIDVPKGLFALSKAGEPVSDQLLANPDLVGIVIRQKWQDIEKTEGQYDWSYIDREFDRVAKAGKKASLLLISGGKATPQWLLDKKIATYQFKDTNPFHDTHGSQVKIPVYWEPLLVAAKTKLIRSAGQRFSEKPGLILVSASCANATTDDWNVPPAVGKDNDAYADEKLIAVCKSIIDETMQAFPKQIIRMAVGNVSAKLTKNTTHAAIEVTDYAMRKYPGRFVVQRHNLFVKTPDPNQTSQLEGWQIIKKNAPYSAAQMLWSAIDTKTCRLNGKTKPCDPEQTLFRSAEIGKAYGISYLEIYGSDVLDKSLSKTITKIALLFKGQSAALVTPTVVDASPDVNIPASVASNMTPVALTHSEERGESGYRRFKMGRRGGQQSETTQWVNEPENRQGSEGVKHFQFDSKALGQPVGYSIYLPKSYDKSGQRYPVIYWLHGKNGNESRGAHIAAYLQSAVDKHLIKEAIMVFPNGGVDSFYSDSYDGKIKVESMLINELIPLIDSTYRTVADRNGRVLEGFSMGGFGALKFMCKYPDKFLSVATFGAALLDRVNPPQRRDAHAYQVMFNDNIDTFDKNTPAYWCEHNRDLLKKLNTKIRIVAGGSDGTRRYNERMHQLLTDLAVEHDYQVLAGVKHIPKQYYDEDAGGSFAFHGLVLGK